MFLLNNFVYLLVTRDIITPLSSLILDNAPYTCIVQLSVDPLYAFTCIVRNGFTPLLICAHYLTIRAPQQVFSGAVHSFPEFPKEGQSAIGSLCGAGNTVALKPSRRVNPPFGAMCLASCAWRVAVFGFLEEAITCTQ